MIWNWSALPRWAIALASAACLYLLIALALIWLPIPEVPAGDKVSIDKARAGGMTLEQLFAYEYIGFSARDGARLAGGRYRAPSPDSLLFLHGAGEHSGLLNNACGRLREAAGIEVFTFDLRGHGKSPGGRGDLSYAGQYARDLADVLRGIRELKPDGMIILAGHSMGGGIIQRYAMGGDGSSADAHLLFAPTFGRGLPGARLPSFARIHRARIVGTLMFNLVGVRSFNHLPVLNLGLPEIEGHVNQYSFVAAASVRPQNHRKGLAALGAPLLIVLGEDDSRAGVTADAVEEALGPNSKGDVVVIEGAGHHVHNHPAAIAAAASWIRSLRADRD